MHATTAIAETAAWLDFLYGDCRASDGWLVVISSTKRSVLKAYPLGNSRDLVHAAELMYRHPGCYVKINPMDYRAMSDRSKATGRPVVGRRDEVKSVVSLHLDVDAGKSEKYASRTHALWAMDSMPLPPTLIVNSGSGGFHAYWKLKHPVATFGKADKIQAVSCRWWQQLKQRLGGKVDNTCNLDRVLRPVGVQRLDGRTVSCERYEPDLRYGMDEFLQSV